MTFYVSGQGQAAEMRGWIACKEKLNARDSKSSGWSENVELTMFAILLDFKKEIFVDPICSGAQKNPQKLFFVRERCPGGECVFHQRSLGRHRMDNRPTDSDGNLCGEGENEGKPYR